MVEMLDELELKLEGRHHSGLDDSNNIARCVLNLLDRGF
jgi:inhibitor of KinA sporulation pathway (predicted exonuclease)